MRYEYEMIITHPGHAHADDVLSLCCVLAVLGVETEVFRREPTPEELENPEILVIDVGGKYEPEKSNYDHHQMERDNVKCALKLLVEDEGNFPELQPLALMDWVGDVSFMDTQGPFKAAERLECDPGVVFTLSSQIEKSIKRLVEKYSGDAPLIEDLVYMLFSMGHVIMDEAKEYQRSYNNLIQCPVEDVAGVKVIFNDSDDTLAMQAVWDEHKRKGVTIACSVSLDDRGEGWSLYRFNDHPSVDFSKIKNRKEILFAHPGGFIAKTEKQVSLEVLGSLLKQSIA